MTTSKPELLRQIATAMEQDPDEWWRGFEWSAHGSHTCWYTPDCPEEIFRTITKDFDIRPRPRTIRIDVEVPEPMREVPEVGQKYWYLIQSSSVGAIWTRWGGDSIDARRFSCGIYTTEAQAQQAADAIFGALGGNR